MRAVDWPPPPPPPPGQPPPPSGSVRPGPEMAAKATLPGSDRSTAGVTPLGSGCLPTLPLP